LAERGWVPALEGGKKGDVSGKEKVLSAKKKNVSPSNRQRQCLTTTVRKKKLPTENNQTVLSSPKETKSIATIP